MGLRPDLDEVARKIVSVPDEYRSQVPQCVSIWIIVCYTDISSFKLNEIYDRGGGRGDCAQEKTTKSL